MTTKKSKKSVKKSPKKAGRKSGKGFGAKALLLGRKIFTKKKTKTKKKKKKSTGKGVINSLINKLPFEMHLPGYQYCGPGTKLDKRLARNDPGVNELDRACKEHDIAYANSNDIQERNHADKVLAKAAWKRVGSRSSGFREKLNALGVAGIMKAKSKLGMGMKSRKGGCIKNKNKTHSQVHVKNKSKRGIKVSTVLKKAKDAAVKQIKNKKPATVPDAAKLAVQAAKAAVKHHKLTDVESGLPRIIPIPKKIGGVLPLIPIFAGLSALGALMGGSASVANAAISASNAKKNLSEANRHNQTMEAIALGKNTRTGSGLFLVPHKKGYGLFLSPHSKNTY